MALGGKGPTVIVILALETAVAGLCVGGRYYTRRVLKAGGGDDDVVLIASWVFMLVFAILFIISSLYGFGQHNTDLDKDDIKLATLYELCGQSAIAIAMGLSKCGVALFLSRIANVKWQKWVLWGWMFTIMFLSIFLAISVFAQCYPTQSLWDANVKSQGCSINLTILAFVMCSFSAAMDFFLAFCPYYILKDLNMNPKERWTIIISLSLGAIAGIFGIVRTAGLSAISNTADYLRNSTDATADSVMFSSTELALTLICVSLPVFRPLFKRLASTRSSKRSPLDGHSHQGSSRGLGTVSRVWKASNGRSKSRENEYGMQSIAEAGVGGVADQSDEEGNESAWKDSASDRSILAEKQGISRKQEFSVSYEERGQRPGPQ
ncbi:hypothetical protein PFICI_12517 [Pestalotiopsis fici W106-1]|uniref:Rhodopsin domain-containing protein n=1 Tax=Pestalotiopsis fici (strain W106-1 / CGMCC3.15140) TaxID=1229662 RepID=W3WNY7_PESFW|nr:uncharacterized protein PFICI_12517 [Pestalotiopsis fici W106-1]ETS75573.1 hypothetical protein PFICI_12517 [Pestalotiopsis fici W106-1]